MKATLSTQKRVSISPQRVGGVLSYDEDNAYPQRVEQIINNSSTGSLCQQLSLMFCFGGGFKDIQFNKVKVNKKGLTAAKLLRKVANDITMFNGVAIHVNFNANYQPVSFNYLPFSFVRLTDEKSKHPDKVALYNNWDKTEGRIVEDDIEYYDFFTLDPEKIQAQVDEAGGWQKYKGQIYYYSNAGKSYPLSTVDPVLEDMQTDALTKTFKYRNISTNFMASYFLEVNAFENDEDREEFEQVLTDFQGADEAMKIMLLEKMAGSEETFNLQKVDIQNVDSLYKNTEESVINSIIRNRLIPPVLLMQTQGKLGTSKEIYDATNYYNGIINHYQQICSEIFNDLFINSTILNSGDFSIVQIKAKAENSEIVSLVSNAGLTSEQKTNLLISLYGYTMEEAQKIAGV